MSWFGNLLETYDRVSDIAGIPDEKGNVLWPLYHTAQKSSICLTIDGNGNFRHVEKNEKRIILPYTEESSSRSGKVIAPHPLHDKLGYLAMNEAKREAYLLQLSAWGKSHTKVQAVYYYISAGTLLDDLEKFGIQAKEEMLVRFRVEIPNDLTPNLWEDKTVFREWINYAREQNTERKLCYVSGIESAPAYKHLKGINPMVNGAKLISCNDETNYTFRGRFNKADQANSISGEVSHKAHAMLNYLIMTQGHRCNTQAVVVWTIDDGSAQPDPFEGSLALFQQAHKTDDEKLLEMQEGQLGKNYAKELRKALCGLGNAHSLTNLNRHVAIIALDAATTGRMGITFYQDLLENEYVERLAAWHESCCWWFQSKGREYVSAPSVGRIITAVYGEPKGDGFKKIQKQARERLLHHIVNGEALDKGWISAAVTRVSNPFSYNKQDGKWDMGNWFNSLNVTCAIIKKYYNRKEEVFTLELDRECKDRDYLFGRLLAIADRIESHARYIQNKNNDVEKRPTNAVRYMSAFTSRPVRTWKLIYDNLNPYIQRLNGAEGYQSQIDEIMSLFDSEEYNDKQLSGKYLLGYSLQRRLYYKENKEGTIQTNNEEGIINEFIKED